MYSIILCGGSGTRLWPLSRKKFSQAISETLQRQIAFAGDFLRMQEVVPKENIYLSPMEKIILTFSIKSGKYGLIFRKTNYKRTRKPEHNASHSFSS